MSKFFCVLNADGSTSCVNADQIISVHDRGGKCRIHLLDGREINLNCAIRTVLLAAGADPNWLNLRPNSEYGEVYSSFPGSEATGSPPASTGPVEAPAVGSYEGDAQGVVPARHTSADEIRARVTGFPTSFPGQEVRRMSEIKVAHELMSARERKSRVLAPLVDSINRSWGNRDTDVAPSVPDFADLEGVRRTVQAYFAIMDQVSRSLVMEKKADPLQVRLLIDKATDAFLAFELHRQRLERELKDHQAKLIAIDKENRELNEALAGYRKATAVAPPDKSAPPESPVPHERSSSDAEQLRNAGGLVSVSTPGGLGQTSTAKYEPSGCSLDPFDSRSAPDVEQLPNSSAHPGARDFEHPDSFPWISDKIRLSIRTGRPITEDDILNLLNTAELRVGVQRESIGKLEKELAGHRRLAEKAGYSPGVPSPAPVVTEPHLYASVEEIRWFRKDICLAVLSKSHATIPEGLAEYSRKLAEAVLLVDQGPQPGGDS